MTKRGKELDMQTEYKQALKAAEDIRPQGIGYTIFSENGSQVGRLIYLSENDTLKIEIGGATIAEVKGEYLNSIHKSLVDLLSDTE